MNSASVEAEPQSTSPEKKSTCRGKRLHTRNQHLGNHRGLQHLGNHRGFSVACSNGFSVAFSNGITHVSCIFQRIVICPVDFYWNVPMDFQWHFPMEFHLRDFWCIILCPEPGTQTGARRGRRRSPSELLYVMLCIVDYYLPKPKNVLTDKD